MNASSTQPFGVDFPKQLVEMFFNALDEGTRQAYRMIWSGITQFLNEHWGWLVFMLIAIFIFSVLNYFATGRWAMLGSVLYNYFYFGTLFVITLIFGPEVFANDWFKIVLFILYVTCFILVGKILNKIGIRR